MRTDLYIGPLIERSGKFSYDTFSLAEGLRSSFRYWRVEEARYDRRTMVAEAVPSPQFRIKVCETVMEFEQSVAAAQAEGIIPDSGHLSEL